MTALCHNRWIVAIVLMSAVIVLCVPFAAPASVIEDVNNMLRDARSTTEMYGGGHMGRGAHGKHASAKPEAQQLLRNMRGHDHDSDSDSDHDIADIDHINDIDMNVDVDNDNDDNEVTGNGNGNGNGNDDVADGSDSGGGGAGGGAGGGGGGGGGSVDNNLNEIAEQSSVELLRFVDDADVANAAAMATVKSARANIAVVQAKQQQQQQQQHQQQRQQKAAAAATEEEEDGEADAEVEAEAEAEGVKTEQLTEGRTTVDTTLSLNDQVRLLTKQLNALMTRRREDYEMLEHNLRKSLRITTDAATVDESIRNEFEQLRREVQTLRDGRLNGNKERLTVEWLQQTVTEIRKQLVELQQVASNVAKDMHTRTQSYEDLATIRNDFQQIKLELVALRERQERSEVYVQELREELVQQEEDFKRLLHNKHIEDTSTRPGNERHERVELSTEVLADHSRRHCRFQHQQIHELQVSQRTLRRQLNELKYHRIGERVRSIEIEQHRIANANFNLSRQIASLDKLHTSMLELLEDVEGIQNKMDKSIPELRHEISKLEFVNAQIGSEQSLMREEGKNAARTLQAMAVSVSALQDERDGIKRMEASVELLGTNVNRLQALIQNELNKQKLSEEKSYKHAAKRIHKHAHREHSGVEEQQQQQTNNNNNNSTEKQQKQTQQQQQQQQQDETESGGEYAQAEKLVAELEDVEAQYETILRKLPHDCSDLPSVNVDGLHMIAPKGQHHPLMTHCSADGWTTVQRRFDGSADFNRSWADYASGFGTPAGEYWIGNEQLHHLTLNNCTRLRVHMQDIYDNFWVAEYGQFYISSRDDGYRLHIAEYSGNASDALNYQEGMQFSAIDDDRDISQTHCAANYEGGWWFSHCQHANLNGRYNLGLTWFDAARNEWIAVKSSQMLVKRQAAATCAFVAAEQSKAMAMAKANAKSATGDRQSASAPVLSTIVSSVYVATPLSAASTVTVMSSDAQA